MEHYKTENKHKVKVESGEWRVDTSLDHGLCRIWVCILRLSLDDRLPVSFHIQYVVSSGPNAISSNYEHNSRLCVH